MKPNDTLATYRGKYPAKAMRRKPNNSDEIRQMQPSDGMYELPSPPAAQAQFSRHPSLPNSGATAPLARHLWVIRAADVPVALEACAWGAALESKSIKHSNLTGGANAHSGGEIWFIDDDHIAVNASSGRYGAEAETEFSDIIEALRRSGYYVASMGFDADNKSVANVVFVGDPEWQPPI